MFVLAQVTASPGSLLIVASHLLFFLVVFLFDVLNVADPRSFHDKARKIHHLFAVFYRPPHLYIFHLPPIFSCPSSRSPPISPVAFPFSCVLDIFSPLLSLLVCLHPFLPSGQPISSYFSPIFLLGCIFFASQPLSSGRSSFFCPPSLFLLFDEPSYSHTLAASVVVVVLSTPLSPDHTGILVQHTFSGL